jgi:hypothetical protein
MKYKDIFHILLLEPAANNTYPAKIQNPQSWLKLIVKINIWLRPYLTLKSINGNYST